MSVFERFGQDRQRVADLSFRALVALSSDSTPDPVREEVLSRAAAGEKFTARQIEEIKRRAERAEKLLSETKGRLQVAEGYAESVCKKIEGTEAKLQFANADKTRLEAEVESLRDEMGRLQEEGVIHVLPAAPPRSQPCRPNLKRADLSPPSEMRSSCSPERGHSQHQNDDKRHRHDALDALSRPAQNTEKVDGDIRIRTHRTDSVIN
ncbi:hypothetical protein [Roseixanthobacter pseudopolyaromaticivorans]|uniref:hypothetical protein n=1 Tax=Xanthobacteraceae TaxID=335928 RepID=UPI00372C19A7